MIDHKSNPMAGPQWDRLADEHASQLGAYADAVQAATGTPVKEM